MAWLLRNKTIYSLTAENKSLNDKLEWQEKSEKQMNEAFEAISLKVFRNNTGQFLEQSKNQIQQIMELMKGDWNTQKSDFKSIVEPLNKDLEKLEKQVNEIEQKREGAYQNLFSQVTNLTKANNDLQLATTTLSSVLKSSSQTRGKWGEMTLKRIVEMSGMSEHVDYDEQKTTDEGSRPDIIIHLPNKGIIPVDSKAPMSAYFEAQELSDNALSEQKLIEHGKAMKNHIQALSKKAYWNQFEIAPEFVVMLIPYESGMNAAFTIDPGLLDYAIDNHVVIVSPATLIALLKVIFYGWMQVSLAENAKKIADQGKELYDRVNNFNKNLVDVGSKLKGSVESYNKAVGSLESRVLPSARKLKEMGVQGDCIETPIQIDTQTRTIEREKK